MINILTMGEMGDVIPDYTYNNSNNYVSTESKVGTYSNWSQSEMSYLLPINKDILEPIPLPFTKLIPSYSIEYYWIKFSGHSPLEGHSGSANSGLSDFYELNTNQGSKLLCNYKTLGSGLPGSLLFSSYPPAVRGSFSAYSL